jgi:hypothetical protein
VALRALAIVALLCSLAHAQAVPLRDANTAASVGDWAKVGTIVKPLLRAQLPRGDRAEAHRLFALAAYFTGDTDLARDQFFEYLKLDLDARLDPTLYPPDVIAFFEGVKIKHAAELRALRPKQRRWMVLNLLPPLGQFQNRQRTKAWILTGTLGTLAVANVTSYLLLKSWCKRVDGSEGSSVVCDDRENLAPKLQAVSVVTGIALVVTYVYGVYDGVTTFNRKTERMLPFVATSQEGTTFGVLGRF